MNCALHCCSLAIRAACSTCVCLPYSSSLSLSLAYCALFICAGVSLCVFVRVCPTPQMATSSLLPAHLPPAFVPSLALDLLAALHSYILGSTLHSSTLHSIRPQKHLYAPPALLVRPPMHLLETPGTSHTEAHTYGSTHKEAPPAFLEAPYTLTTLPSLEAIPCTAQNPCLILQLS